LTLSDTIDIVAIIFQTAGCLSGILGNYQYDR
jgi:hypothetical protein